MADVTVSFAAVDEGLSSAIDGIKSKFQMLAAGAPGSGLTTALPRGLGGASQTPLLDAATEAAKRNTGATKELSEAQEELGQSSARAGINIGNLLERIGLRLVVFEALRLAIQGVKYAFDLISNLQQAQLQFDAMSDATDHLAGRFQFLKEGAEAAFTPIEKAVQVRNALQDYGASADQAAIITKELDQWAKILGVDAVKLAESLGRVAQGEGSLQDMRLVTRMMGEQSEAGRELIQTYINLQKAQKNLEAENAAVEHSMEAVMRATKEMAEDAERQTDRQMALLEKLAAAETKKAQAEYADEMKAGPARERMNRRLGIAQNISRLGVPEGSEELLARKLEFGGMIGGMRVPLEAQEQYRRGLEEIGALEGKNAAQVRAQVSEGILGHQDVMRAGREATDDQMRGLDRMDEARKSGMEAQKLGAAEAVTAAKAAITTGLPQAVTAPPAAQWMEFVNSLKGQGLQTKQDFDNGIQKVVDELGKVTKAADGTTTAVGGLENLFRSG